MRLAIILACVLATPAEAYVSSEGHEYISHCTKDGLVLQTEGTVTRTLENGANTQYVRGPETIYLGRGCDAYTKAWGYGTWAWANGGFVVTFPRYEYGFPRQEIYCPKGDPQPFDEALQCRM